MHITALQRAVIAGATCRRSYQHLREWIIALIFLRQYSEQPATLLIGDGATRRCGTEGVRRGESGEAQTGGDTSDKSSARKHVARLRTQGSESNLFPVIVRELPPVMRTGTGGSGIGRATDECVELRGIDGFVATTDGPNIIHQYP